MRPKPLLTLLNSVKTQTNYPHQILIVDGSTNDATEQMLSKENFSNLEYVRVEDHERGLTRQRNKGISLVDKDVKIVCFLDDDTILEDDYFDQLLSTYSKYPEALAVGGYITNEVTWKKSDQPADSNEFAYDGYTRIEGSRFKLRRIFGLIDDTPPGFMPPFSNGRSVSFLPPTNKIYEVEQIMGGVSSYRTEVFEKMSFSHYFEGYGLYEDADFALRLSKIGKLYINTAARLEHHHDAEGRPNKFKYGKMVLRNGWYVWRVRHSSPKLKDRFKWNAIALLQTLIRFSNVLTTSKRKEAFTEAMGRTWGWWTLLFNKPKVIR